MGFDEVANQIIFSPTKLKSSAKNVIEVLIEGAMADKKSAKLGAVNVNGMLGHLTKDHVSRESFCWLFTAVVTTFYVLESFLLMNNGP